MNEHNDAVLYSVRVPVGTEIAVAHTSPCAQSPLDCPTVRIRFRPDPTATSLSGQLGMCPMSDIRCVHVDGIVPFPADTPFRISLSDNQSIDRSTSSIQLRHHSPLFAPHAHPHPPLVLLTRLLATQPAGRQGALNPDACTSQKLQLRMLLLLLLPLLSTLC